jgi:GntR family transcriptional regulator/MocR family aminotransferase
MAKTVSPPELALSGRPPGRGLAGWLYSELRSAILTGRLTRGTRLPASRDFARLHGIARGTVVAVFERLQAEGYVSSRVGRGTWVNHEMLRTAAPHAAGAAPEFARRIIAGYARPKALRGLAATPPRPFQMGKPALAEFPARVWARLAARRARRLGAWLRLADDGRGYRPLREALAQHLGLTRGIHCHPDQVSLVSGTQQALDVLARFLVQPGEPVWMEDPGYFGAAVALQNAGAQLVPVPVDREGLSVAQGLEQLARPRGIYLTPAHQFPLGVAMSAARRLQVLEIASRVGAFIIEDDYDSEFRFEGRPLPALQSLDRGSTVILVGTFSKTLFPALRMGYVVMPSSLTDYFLAFQHRTQLCSVHLDQSILCDFIVEGHLGRHIRRMRNLYAGRLACLAESARRQLAGLLEIDAVRAGLYTAAYLENGMTSADAERAAFALEVDALALDRFTFKREDPRGLLLGFAAFDEKSLRQGVIQLAQALEPRTARRR